MKVLLPILALFLLFAGCIGSTDSPVSEDQQNEVSVSLANPASAYCIEQGGTLEMRENSLGQYGVCIKGGNECDEWAFFRGECLL